MEQAAGFRRRRGQRGEQVLEKDIEGFAVHGGSACAKRGGFYPLRDRQSAPVVQVDGSGAGAALAGPPSWIINRLCGEDSAMPSVRKRSRMVKSLSLIHISEPTRPY